MDNPGGENHGYYRVGFDLNAAGQVTGGWSAIQAIPGWSGSEDQGAGIAATDLNGNGRPDLVVMHVDNPAGENAGFHRVVYDLMPTGATARFSIAQAAPGVQLLHAGVAAGQAMEAAAAAEQPAPAPQAAARSKPHGKNSAA